MSRGGVKYKYIINKNNFISIYCATQEQDSHITDASSRPIDRLSATQVSLSNCFSISTTYADQIEALNIDASVIDTLYISFVLDSPLPLGNYTEGLTVRSIDINQYNKHYILEIPPNFLHPLNKLKIMTVEGIEISSLPETTQIIFLRLKDRSVIKSWGNCQHLKYLDLENTGDIPIWPRNCTRLEELSIKNVRPATALLVAERMIAAAPSLRKLSIIYCQLNSLPIKLIRAAKKLVYLNLSYNAINDDLLQDFPYHTALQTLDLSGNIFRGDSMVSLLPKLRILFKLFLRDEKYSSYVSCWESRNKTSTTSFAGSLPKTSVEFIDLTDTPMNFKCFNYMRFLKLKQIKAPIVQADDPINLRTLPLTMSGHLDISFNNHNRNLPIRCDKEDYETLRTENSSSPYNGRNLTILLENNIISCDCENNWLVRTLQDFPHIISVPNLKCNHKYGIPVLEIPIEHTECNKSSSNYCTYKQRWRDGTVTAECNKEGWIGMEYDYPLHGLNVSGQDIFNLHTKIQDNIKWLDLRYNSLSRASAKEATVLFAAERRVWLADNDWLCDCKNRVLLDAIHQHREQVQDYDLLKCVGTGEALSSISTDVLCQVALISSLSVCGVLLLIAGVIALLLRRYGEQLSMFLYSRGWCISCLQRMDIDDKPYDAFLSFAHEDQEYVMETLLPGLENAPEKFRICVHYRDWFVGDWIPSQIMRSVQLSKRTLILLSRKFVISPWSTLELRYSLANAVDDPNAKVLVLIKDDVLDMDLDKGLRRYLTFHTYLRCDDPWFWEKLRYAMPHRVKNNSLGTEDIEMGTTDRPAVEIFQNHQNNGNGMDSVQEEVVEVATLPSAPTRTASTNDDIDTAERDEQTALEPPNVVTE